MSKETLENILLDLDCYGIDFCKEFKFDVTGKRKFRFDFYIPLNSVVHGIGIEYDGAVWVAGRHTRGSGFVKDQTKCNLAISQGYLVLRYASPHFSNNNEIEAVKQEILRTVNRYKKRANL